MFEDLEWFTFITVRLQRLMFVDVLQIISLYSGYQSVINTVFLLKQPLSYFLSSWWEYKLKEMSSLCWLFVFKNGLFSSMCKYNSVKYMCLSDAMKCGGGLSGHI